MLSYYKKIIAKTNKPFIEIYRKLEVISILKIGEKIKSELSVEDISNKYKNEIVGATGFLNDAYIKNCIIKDYNLMDEYDIIIFTSYNIVKLFDTIFPFSQNINVDVNKRFDLFKIIFTNLGTFEKTCTKINDKHIESLVFASACIALSKIVESENKIYEIKDQEKLLDLIDFSEDSIYKSALDNNKEFINKLKINSFLFIYLLQFNSAKSQISINDENITKNVKEI